ncbi:Pom152p NDAI_0H02770 [Naumovozyma dairenensis CBS 421]|uniref:Nucleoporin POM152 n=1 Tax=Naumovozyma dairenensis (strain ATCC 10597 / BCRC 20456 / CBS 421 / NBRC 0211 / NRRL Y-12639) TaxID=1071378 RepID=G0WF90_NAUDC|nr:hypothetical protein NDAI_0H02770 [Naumovozyma dairenensis CBS 421]CCD26451.1 hypothetical protein NDAI_0H02770 [Naumovozyma dairenensis CBS 421]
MENRYNIFNDTPRGDHWMKTYASSSPASPIDIKTQEKDAFSSYNAQTTNNNEHDFTIRSRHPRSSSRSSPDIHYTDHHSSPLNGQNNNNKNSKGNGNNNANIQPLISTDILEVSKQRTLILLLFLLIQGYKIYDLILLKSGLPVPGILFNSSSNFYSRFNFISKYLIIDSMFFYLLPTFNIPKLTFTKWIVIIQIAIMSITTIVLSQEHNFIFISMMITSWKKLYSKELSVTGSTINHRKLMKSSSSSHFKGALTIKILPENTAMLNPLHDSFCLPLDSNLNGYIPNNSLNIPIRINSTQEIQFIQLEYRDLYTNEIQLRNLTKGKNKNSFKIINDPTFLILKDSKLHGDTSKDSTIRYINIPINEIGFYQIKKIVDSKGLSLKILKSHLIVPHCPIASISSPTNSLSKDKCIGDVDSIAIDIQGVPPLKLIYSKIIDGKVYQFEDDNLQPEYFQSPLQYPTSQHTQSKENPNKNIHDKMFDVDSSHLTLHSHSQRQRKRFVFNDNELSDLQWAHNQPVHINLSSIINEKGHYSYRIDKLIDSLGNIIDFSTFSNELLEKFDSIYQFNAHSIPKASLEEHYDPYSPTKTSIFINFEDDDTSNKDNNNNNNSVLESPYNVVLSYTDSNGNKKNLDNITSHLMKYKFDAPYPGAYTLESINSNFCPGVIIGKSDVLVTEPIPPTLKVTSRSIMDECVGQTGLNFDLLFTGIPPYNYNAKIYKMIKDPRTNKIITKLYDTKRLDSKTSRNKFTFIPSQEGDYQIIFDNLTNDLFRDPIQLLPANDYTFKTSMRVKPSARINSKKLTSSSRNDVIKLCLGGHTKIPIDLKGEPPFYLKYDILETMSNKRTTYEVDDINSTSYYLDTPIFNTGGDYILSLVSIKDTSGCLVGLSEPDARIKVRRDIPFASFNQLEEGKIMIREGATVDIALKLNGDPPFKVKYEYRDLNHNLPKVHETVFHSNYKPVLKVSKEGSYKLLEMKDSTCDGTIENGSNEFVNVTFLDKPTFEIKAPSKKGMKVSNEITKLTEFIFKKNDVCQNTETTVGLQLSGSPPFILGYDIMSPNGQVTNNKIQVATRYASIKLPNTEPGEYIATIKELYDSNYGEADLKKLNTFKKLEITVKQMVNPIPEVEFNDPGKTFKACSISTDQSSELKPINLKLLNGKGPYTITFNINHESTSRSDEIVIANITNSYFPYEKLYEGLRLGNHEVTIAKIIDSNGCTNEFVDTNNFNSGYMNNNNNNNLDNKKISISITDVPKIHLLDSSVDYCVGDYVTYQLNGIAPFTIKYEFNDIPLKSQEYTSQFIRLASEAGIISINSIQDSSSQCIVNFNNNEQMIDEYEKLRLEIHPIPSVTVSQGDYVIEDIHEGDQVEVTFSFEGTPPFSLTYVRREEIDGKNDKNKQQVAETHKVSDIMDFEYKIITSLQGTYEAIEISDAYCFVKNDAFFNT